MHPLVALARRTVEQYVRAGTRPAPPHEPADVMQGRAGVFVSLKKRGELRGCIGTIFPATKSVSAEVIENAVSAATKDPRFSPVTESELPDIQYSVDVLSEPEDVADTNQLDPGRYGVIVSDGARRGLLLPDLEGVDTVEEQLRIASMKAGLVLGDPNVSIQRFEVKRYR